MIAKIENHAPIFLIKSDIYKETLKLKVGYNYQEISTYYDASENYSTDASAYIKQIKDDLKLIKIMQLLA